MTAVEGITVDKTIAEWARRCLEAGFRITAASSNTLAFHPADRSLAPISISPVATRSNIRNKIYRQLVTAGMPADEPKPEQHHTHDVDELRDSHGEVITVDEARDRLNRRYSMLDDDARVVLYDALSSMLDGRSDIEPLHNTLAALTVLSRVALIMHHEDPGGGPAAKRLAELEVQVVDLQRDVDDALQLVERADTAKAAMISERDQLKAECSTLRVQMRDMKQRMDTFTAAMRGLTANAE